MSGRFGGRASPHSAGKLGMGANSPEYERTLAKARAAAREFTKAQEDYRAKRIGDKEYLAARKIYEQSDKDFDVARGELAPGK